MDGAAGGARRVSARAERANQLVLRDRDAAGDSGTLDERLYCLMDYFDPVAVVDREGEVVERYGWTAFGLREVMAPDWSAREGSEFEWSFGFHGQFLDGETGYYNYGFRYYSPEIGRWLSRDPIGEEGGWNLYGFARNMPVGNLDLLGLAVAENKESFNDILQRRRTPSSEDLALKIGIGTLGYVFPEFEFESQVKKGFFSRLFGGSEELILTGSLSLTAVVFDGATAKLLEMHASNAVTSTGASPASTIAHERYHFDAYQNIWNQFASDVNVYEGTYRCGCARIAEDIVNEMYGRMRAELEFLNSSYDYDQYAYRMEDKSEKLMERMRGSRIRRRVHEMHLQDAKDRFQRRKCVVP